MLKPRSTLAQLPVRGGTGKGTVRVLSSGPWSNQTGHKNSFLGQLGKLNMARAFRHQDISVQSFTVTITLRLLLNVLVCPEDTPWWVSAQGWCRCKMVPPLWKTI